MPSLSRSDLIAEARGFAEWWRLNPQNSDVIYAVVRTVDGEAEERRVTATMLDRLADALEAAESRATEAEAARDAALAVFEKAQAPTSDEKEWLIALLLRSREWNVADRADAILAGFRRTVQGEPTAARDAALAVIEEAREWRDPAYEAGLGSPDDYANGYRMALRNIRRILSSVPADVLRERDRQVAERAWDEGFDAGRDDLGAAARAVEHDEDENPYRIKEEN